VAKVNKKLIFPIIFQKQAKVFFTNFFFFHSQSVKKQNYIKI